MKKIRISTNVRNAIIIALTILALYVGIFCIRNSSEVFGWILNPIKDFANSGVFDWLRRGQIT